LSLRSGIAGQALMAVVFGPAGAPAKRHWLANRNPAANTIYWDVTADLQDGRGVALAAAMRRWD